MRNRWLAVVALVVLPALAWTEDSPVPAPGASNESKSETAADAGQPKAATPAGSAAPAGAPPELPLKSEHFADVKDARLPAPKPPKGQQPKVERDDAEQSLVGIEPAARDDIFAAVQACSFDYLKSHVDPKLNYESVYNNPQGHRGEVIKLTGILGAIYPYPDDKRYSMGQISVGSRITATFITLDPLPPDVQVGRSINVIGIFMKRYDYINASDGIEVTPLVIVRRVERALDYDPATYWMNSWPGILFFVVIGGGLAFYCWARMTGKGKYPNRFTRMKEDRAPPQGNFPRKPQRSFPRPQK